MTKNKMPRIFFFFNGRIIKNQIKSIGEHTIEINPYEDIAEEFLIQVNKN